MPRDLAEEDEHLLVHGPDGRDQRVVGGEQPRFGAAGAASDRKTRPRREGRGQIFVNVETLHVCRYGDVEHVTKSEKCAKHAHTERDSICGVVLVCVGVLLLLVSLRLLRLALLVVLSNDTTNKIMAITLVVVTSSRRSIFRHIFTSCVINRANTLTLPLTLTLMLTITLTLMVSV